MPFLSIALKLQMLLGYILLALLHNGKLLLITSISIVKFYPKFAEGALSVISPKK